LSVLSADKHLSDMSTGNPAVRAKTVGNKASKVSNVWMLSYECAGIAQAGGLGEAVAGLARTLASDYRLDVTVLLPSHGRHSDPDLRESYNLREEARFIGQGYRIGVDGISYRFLSGIETGVHDNVRFVLVKGLDAPTSHWLDSPVLYDHDLTFEKMALFARTVKLYSEYLLSMQRQAELPDLIHAHDWHMVPAGVSVKQHLQERGSAIPLVFTVHLLSHVTLAWHYASEDWCGIKDLSHRVRLSKNRPRTLTYRQIWEGQSDNSLERFGCYEADYVTSVSESYLTRDVVGYAGNVIKWKSGHVYNGCDWDYDEIKSTVLTERKELTTGPEPAKLVNRWDLRKLLLTSEIAKASTGIATGNLTGPSTTGDSQKIVEPFRTDGPLVLMTGRLSPQKGADLLLDAVPLVTKVVPSAKFLLFLLPSGDTVQMSAIEENASSNPESVRTIFAKNRPIYMMSHIAADVYAMPSRSEPFGISALEAMATGNPVVGSNLGGIKETVLDIESHGSTGTGMLVAPENARALANSLISMLLVMQIDEQTQRGEKDPVRLLQNIPSKPLADLVRRDLSLASKIRENCRSRVEQNFRWKNAGQAALERYATALSLAIRHMP
jgi:starch synthase